MVLSKELGIDIVVEIDLHEWIPDLSFQYYKTQEECRILSEDFTLHNGIYPENEQKLWESNESMKKRMENVLIKYTGYKKVIVACHSMVMHALTGRREPISYGEIVVYRIGK